MNTDSFLAIYTNVRRVYRLIVSETGDTMCPSNIEKYLWCKPTGSSTDHLYVYSSNDALSDDTKVNDLVTLNFTVMLKIAF